MRRIVRHHTTYPGYTHEEALHAMYEDTHRLVYRTREGRVRMLQRLGSEAWGFADIEAPSLVPTYIHKDPEETLEVARWDLKILCVKARELPAIQHGAEFTKHHLIYFPENPRPENEGEILLENVDLTHNETRFVVYKSPNSGWVKLQKLNGTNAEAWGFFYLARPDRNPVFVDRSAKLAIGRVLDHQKNAHQLYSGDYNQFLSILQD